MEIKNPVTLAIDSLRFDEFGAYEVKEVLTEDELEFISGGKIIGADAYCPTNNCPTNNCTNNGCSKNNPNSSCGEDDDSNI